MSLKSPHTEVLLLAFTQPGPDLTEDDFHEWYDEEHVPARTAIDGFQSAIRLEAIDGAKPHWGAIYDLDSMDVLNSEEYKEISKNRSEREKSVIARLTPLDRRIYTKVSGRWKTAIGTEDHLIPKVYLIVSMTPKGEMVQEFDRWYEEEHLDLLSCVPGWIRSRRFELAEQGGTPEKPPKYLAIHEFKDEKGFKSAEYKTATNTPWRTKVMEGIVARERREFKVWKVFK